MTTALIDGDIIAYKCCAFWEKDFEGITDETLRDHVVRCVTSMCFTWLNKLPEGSYDDVRVAISGKDNFRKRVHPLYKANRDGDKPLYLREVEDKLLEWFGGERVYGLEADDLLSIWQRDPSTKTIIVSEDKDLIQCGGKFYRAGRNLNSPLSLHHTEDSLECDRLMYEQWLCGDRTDNLKGAKGIGPKKAHEALARASSTDEMYNIGLDLFQTTGVDEDTAIRELRCIRLIRDWDEWESLKESLGYENGRI